MAAYDGAGEEVGAWKSAAAFGVVEVCEGTVCGVGREVSIKFLGIQMKGRDGTGKHREHTGFGFVNPERYTL